MAGTAWFAWGCVVVVWGGAWWGLVKTADEQQRSDFRDNQWGVDKS
jgi:hypothetical protein